MFTSKRVFSIGLLSAILFAATVTSLESAQPVRVHRLDITSGSATLFPSTPLAPPSPAPLTPDELENPQIPTTPAVTPPFDTAMSLSAVARRAAAAAMLKKGPVTKLPPQTIQTMHRTRPIRPSERIKAGPLVTCLPVYTGNTVSVSGLFGTGINHWWTYEEDQLGGVGRYMVNVATGNLIVQADDMAIPHRGIELALRRTYNALSSHDAAGDDGSPNLYGDKWTSTFDAHIAYNDFAVNNCQHGVTVFDIDGAHYDYSPSGDGSTWIGPAGQFAKLSFDSLHLQYNWVKKTGTTYVFWDINQAAPTVGYSGQIKSILGRNTNNSLSFVRAWSNGDSSTLRHLQTMTVQTETGDARKVVLNYGDVTQFNQTFRLLSNMVWPDTTTTVLYKYAIQQCVCPGNWQPLLTEVDEPSNGTTTAWPNNALPQQYNYQNGYALLQSVYSPRWVLKPNQVGDGPAYSIGYGTFGNVTEVDYEGDVNPADLYTSGSIQSGVTADFGYNSFYRKANFCYTNVGGGGGCNADGGQTTWSDADGHQTTYLWDSIGRVTQRQDTTGDPSGGVATLTTLLTWDANNNLTSSTDARNNRTDYAYDNNGNTIAVAQPTPTAAGFRPTALYSYDSNNNIIAYCDPVWSHSNSKDWTSTPGPSDTPCPSQAATTRYSWPTSAPEPYGELTQVVTPATSQAPNGYTTKIAYDPASQGGTDYGLPTSVSGVSSFTQTDGSSINPTKSFVYDSQGNLVCYSKGNSEWWVLQYDLYLGRLLKIGDPDDASMNGYANGFSCTKTAGIPGASSPTIATVHTYFANGQVNTTQTPSEAASGVATAFVYDADGNETAETHHYNNVAGTTTKLYDGADRLVEVRLPYDNSTLADGFRSDLYAFPWVTRYLYDLTENGLNGSISMSGGSAFAAHGNLYKTQEYLTGGWIDSKGNAYDALDRSTQAYTYSINFPSGPRALEISNSTYDASTDSVGYLSSACNPVSQCMARNYDGIGRQTQIIFSGANAPPVRQFTYDADSRTVSIAQQPFGTQGYSYDGAGELITATEPTGGGITSPAKLTYLYYQNGWKSGLSVDPVSTGFTQHNILSYNYQSDGLLKSEQYLYSGSFQPGTYSFAWTYTSGGRTNTRLDISPDARTIGNTQYSYDTYGRVATYTIPAGTYSNFSYDAENEKIGFTAYGGSLNPIGYNIRGEMVGHLASNKWAYTHSANGFLNPAQFVGPQTPSHYSLAGTTFDATTGAIVDQTSASCSDVCPDTTWYYDNAGRVGSAGDTWISGTKLAHNGTLSHSYDPENHELTNNYSNWGFALSCSSQSAHTFNMTYQWGPNGHPVMINNETLHWDGDTLLFTTNSLGTVDDIKIGMLADETPLDPGWAGLTIWDRDLSGKAESDHNWSGHDHWESANVFNQSTCSLVDVPAAKNSWATQFSTASNFASNQNAIANNRYVGNTAWVYAPGTDGYSDGVTVFQGVRNYDPEMGSWVTPDAFAGVLHDPMSQKPYMWNRNNPVGYQDPSGYDSTTTMVIRATLGGLGRAIMQVLADFAVGVGIVGTVLTPTESADTSLSGIPASTRGWELSHIGAKEKESLLPRSGDVTYRAPKTKSGNLPRDRQGGIQDKNGNSWRWDGQKGEWDVQHPDGSHTNVNPQGEITHGPNNFPSGSTNNPSSKNPK